MNDKWKSFRILAIGFGFAIFVAILSLIWGKSLFLFDIHFVSVNVFLMNLGVLVGVYGIGRGRYFG